MKSNAAALARFQNARKDGAEALKRLRADPNPAIAQIPVIMLTGPGESAVNSQRRS